MKTTIDLSDELAKKAKAFAARQNMTLRALVELSIRRVLRDERTADKFVFRDASVDGKGLQKEHQGSDWSSIREAAYKGRGS